MAEFVEVMKQAKRMCDAHRDCNQCALYRIHTGVGCALDYMHLPGGVSPDAVEYRIRAWATAHPEPTYPSWKDGWKQEFPSAIAVPCPRFFYDYPCEEAGDCKKCNLSPMPAEIAEKLGIKPITPDKPVPEHDGCEGCRYSTNWREVTHNGTV
nr:MAG TPA: hypothetical protein [Caudoviricetes sp.]